MRCRHICSCSVLLLSLTFGACKSREDRVSADELPDLSKQTRPYVTVGSTTVRTGPGAQFRSLGKIPANAKVHVVGRDCDWLLIVSKKGNAPGFIEIASVQPGEGEEQPEGARPAESRQ